MNAITDNVGRPGQPGVTSSFYRRVDAEPDVTRAALVHLDPLADLIGGLAVLGLDDRVRSYRQISQQRSDLVYGLSLRIGDADRLSDPVAMDGETFARAGHVKLGWTVTVEPDGAEASLVSVSLAGSGTDAASSRRLLAAWQFVGALAECHSHRTLAAIAEFAEVQEWG